MSTIRSSGRISFGPFVFDASGRELRNQQQTVHLTPKAFDLLSALIEQRPRPITKTALYELLWPDTFVDEANLAVLIGEIRAALGDRARKPTYIRTVHRFGYAFCGQATRLADSPANQTASFWLSSDTRQVPLHEGENIIGRDPSADVWLDTRSISRRHARIVVAGAEVRVEDIGSKNGTSLNGRRIEAAEPLNDGDQLGFGSVPMTFRIWSDGESTDTTGITSWPTLEGRTERSTTDSELARPIVDNRDRD
jgi:DNA-binding winged helix-turn-helix (wHTH) protein